MRTELARIAIAAALSFATLPAAACGFCDEDRVAAVFDQSVVTRAVARHNVVAFLSMEGEVPVNAATARAILAALEAGGGVRGSARVALENAACSIAYDPSRTKLASLIAKADRLLAARGITLKALRVTGPDGGLKEPD